MKQLNRPRRFQNDGIQKKKKKKKLSPYYNKGVLCVRIAPPAVFWLSTFL